MKDIKIKEIQLDHLMPFIKERLSEGQNIKFSPRGISMLPMLRQGIDCVVLSPIQKPLKKYDIPLYQRDDGRYILHRIVAVDETYTCRGDNQYEYEYGVRPDQMIAVVTSFTRGNKEIPVTNLSYRIYCVVWHYLRPVKKILGRGKRWMRRRRKRF